MTLPLNSYKPHFAVLAILALASLALKYGVDVRVMDDVAVTMALPSQVGDWRGEDIFFCRNEKCQRSFVASQLTGPTTCPLCGGELRQTWSLAESWALSADTVLLKKAYTNPSGQRLTVSIVVTGQDQGSIHRPEMCLVAQGNEVTGQTIFSIEFPARKSLSVRALEFSQRRRAASGSMTEIRGYYAYWFVSPGRETPYHVMRMAYTAVDRIFFAKTYRWSYIAISGARTADFHSCQEQMRPFIQAFYPMITKPSGQ